MDKKPLIGVILCFILFFSMVVPIHVESKKVDCEVKEETSNHEIYFFAFAFIIGKYDNCSRWIADFTIWNPDHQKTTIYVLGYSDYKQTFIPVKAWHVMGGPHIGFIGRHHCCMFTFSFLGVTVEGDGPY